MSKNLMPLYPPRLNTSQRNALPASLLQLDCVIYHTDASQYEKWNGTSWVLAFSGGGSFTPLSHIPAPADTDAARQAFLLNLRTEMISKGMMLPPPTFQVNGVITGAVVAGVNLQLVGAQTYTATSDGAGNFSFPAVENGAYTLTPAIAGHYFTPTNRSITVAGGNVTAQNFVSVLQTSSTLTSPSHVVLQSSFVRALQKTPRSQVANVFPAITTQAYIPCFFNGRWFIPSASSVFVYDESFVLKQTINPLVGSTNAVYGANGKICIVGQAGVRFGTYNTATDAWTQGNSIFEVSHAASCMRNGEVFGSSSFGGSPARNITKYNILTEAVTRYSILSNANLNSIAIGNTTILVQLNATNFQVVDATTFAPVGSAIPILGGDNPRLMQFSQGRYWAALLNQDVLAAISETGVRTNYAGFGGRGCIADDNFIYVGTASGLAVVNASTGVEDGTRVASLASFSMFTS